MNLLRGTWMCLFPLAAMTIGCQNKLHEDNLGLRNQNIELQADKSRLESDLAGRPQPQDLATLQSQIAERDRAIADLQTQLKAPPVAGEIADPALAGITVSRDDRAGTITVNVPGDVLFASGDATVKKSADATLNKIAAIIKKDFAGKTVFVDGHSDSDPITRTKDKWRDNLDLSAARARSVAAFLTDQGGLPKSQVGTRAFGPTSPKASKDKSRRVEIVVVTK